MGDIIGSVDTRRMTDQELIDREVRIARDLRTVHEELRRRQHVCTDVSTDAGFALAQHYFAQLMTHEMQPHQLGAVRSYFSFLVDKEVEKQAKIAAMTEARAAVESRLNAMRAAEVVE